MIDRLLPSTVIAVVRRGDEADAVLFPEEAALIDGAVETRLAEFRTARHCAREALRRIGAPVGAILRGDKREPVWPAGIVGSITHCTGFRAAAVARGEAVLAIGIDAEPHASLPAGVARRVLRDEERDWVAEAPPGVHWGRVIFSAKESVYKTWFPITRRWLDFDDAYVTVDPAVGAFRARLLVDPPHGVPTEFSGRYLVEDGLVLTAIAVLR